MTLQNSLNNHGHFLFRWRSFLPLLFLFPGFYLYTQTEFLRTSFLISDFAELFYLFIGLAGLAIRAYTIGYAGVKTSGRNTTKQVAESLNTLDIYSMVRNPLYVGNFLMWLACTLMIGNIWVTFIFITIFWLFYERIIFTEELFLTKKFGQEYLDYASRTPVFIPNIFKFRSSGKKFDWRRVFIQEKNGLLALFLIFSLFEFWEIMAMFIQHDVLKIDFDDIIIFVGTGLSLLVYFFFKFLKSKSMRSSKRGLST